jgi:hypothetical protein
VIVRIIISRLATTLFVIGVAAGQQVALAGWAATDLVDCHLPDASRKNITYAACRKETGLVVGPARSAPVASQAPTLPSPPAATLQPLPSVADPAFRLRQLEDIYHQRLITPDEYQAKRKAILDSM